MHIKNKIEISLFHFFDENDNSRVHKLFNTLILVLEETEVHMEGHHLEYGREELQ